MTRGTKQLNTKRFLAIMYEVASGNNSHKLAVDLVGREWNYILTRRNKLESEYAEIGQEIELPRFCDEPIVEDNRGRKARDKTAEIAEILAMQNELEEKNQK
jgi:hypothetical protein